MQNCETRLSSLFLGHGDHFWQSYDENSLIFIFIYTSYAKRRGAASASIFRLFHRSSFFLIDLFSHTPHTNRGWFRALSASFCRERRLKIVSG